MIANEENYSSLSHDAQREGGRGGGNRNAIRGRIAGFEHGD